MKTATVALLLSLLPAAAMGQPAPSANGSPAEAGARGQAIPLHGPSNSKAPQRGGSADSAKRVVLSLALVLGAFFLVAWLGRKRMEDDGTLPAEAVAVLGQIPLGPRESVRLVQVGAKLVLVASSPQGLSPLTEVDDPQEVRRLIEQCRATGQGGSIASRRRAA